MPSDHDDNGRTAPGMREDGRWTRSWSRRELLRAVAAAVPLAGACGPAPLASADTAVLEGDGWYRSGRFSEANAAYRRALDADPDHLAGLVGAGATALLHNHLDDATRWLERAVERDPGNVRALQDLAQAAYRRDDFPASAGWRRRLATQVGGDERHDIDVVARKLGAFTGSRPYRVGGDARDVEVPFLATDPLPSIEVTLDDRLTLPFFLDTGADEIYLDRAVAHELGVPTFGATAQSGAGGKEGTAGHGRLRSVEVGGLTVHDVPVKTLDFPALGFPDEWKGALGTCFLYHFLSTIDYPRGALVLRPRNAGRLREFEEQLGTARGHTVPFWLSGSHTILAWGRVNDGDPMLLFADTGGAGVALYATNATVERAGITLHDDQATQGTGAGGAVAAVPFTVDRLTLGDVTRTDLPGIATPDSDPGTVLGRDGVVPRGFPIGGFISHQFFRPYALTLDFDGMRLFLS